MKKDDHLLIPFHYCPVCGSPRFSSLTFKSWQCGQCGFELFLNSAASVVCILVQNNQILVARRACSPCQGMLDFPGGFVDPGESLEDALRREAAEEMGIEVTPDQLLFSLPNRYRYAGMDIPTTDNFFLCRTSDFSHIQAKDDVAELQWMSWEDLQPKEFAFASMRNAIPLLKERLSGRHVHEEE